MKKITKFISALCVFAMLIMPLNHACVVSAATNVAASTQTVDATKDVELYGSAKKQSDESIMLTPLETFKSGGVWFNHQINAMRGFEVSFDFKAGGGRSDSFGGADGMVLSFTTKTGLGKDAGTLGFLQGNNAYGVELDSYPKNEGDIDKKHVAIIKDNTSNHMKSAADDRVDDERWHNLKVIYDGTSKKMSVLMDESLVVDANEVALSQFCYLGITAATGDGKNYHYIRDFVFKGYVSVDQAFDTKPIIIIPGIMGSRLFNSNEDFSSSHAVWSPHDLSTVWNIGKNITMDKTLYVRPCENQNIDTSKEKSSGVAKYGQEYGAQDSYKDLVKGLCKNFSYEDPDTYRPVYFYSYDWRYSNTISAQKLQTAVQKVLDETGSSQVDFVCHSMGGLVASSYFTQYSSEGKVDKIITCGTPYEGAAKLIDAMINKDTLGNGNWLGKENKIDLLLAARGLSGELKASFDGVCELTPTAHYIERLPMWQDSAKWFSRGDYELSYEEYTSICNEIFGSSRYNNAVAFQEGLHGNDGYNKLLTYNRAYFIVGIKHKTISAVKFQYNNTQKINERMFESDCEYDIKGDGTVPYYSASICERIPTLDSTRFLTLKADHGETANCKKSIKWITDILNDRSATVAGDTINPKEYTVIRIACPVNVSIKLNGEELSSDPNNYNDETSFGRLDIIGTEEDPIKMVCIDASADYDITITGTGTGTMDYTIRQFSANEEMVSEKGVEKVAITPTTIIKTTADPAKENVLSVDSNGDGKVDSTLELATDANAKKNDVVTVKGIKYKVTDTKKKTVSVVKPTKKTIKSVSIPATIKINGKTYKVTAIEKNAFKNCKKLKKVTVGKNVTKIGKNAFKNCKKLKKITIKNKKLKKKYKLRT